MDRGSSRRRVMQSRGGGGGDPTQQQSAGASDARAPGVTGRGGVGRAQQPKILMKPKARFNDEEWPSISTGGGPSGTQQLQRGTDDRDAASVASTAASDTGSQPSFSSVAQTSMGFAAGPGDPAAVGGASDDVILTSTVSKPTTVLLKSKTAAERQSAPSTRGTASTGSSQHPHLSAAATAAVSAALPTQQTGKHQLANQSKAAVPLITDNMDFLESSVSSLFDGENGDFLVIGVIGPQATGKSTLISMLGGNEPSDLYRQYIFRPSSRESMESCHHQTGGVQVYVTPSRTILLDCQAIQSLSVLDDFIRQDRRYSYDYKTTENAAEIESVQLCAFMVQACHVLLLVADWFVDVDVCRLLVTSASYRPTSSQAAADNLSLHERKPVLAVIQQRSKPPDYQPHVLRDRLRLMVRLFDGADFQIQTNINLHATRMQPHSAIEHEFSGVNYFPMSDIKLRTQRGDDGEKGSTSDSPRLTPRPANKNNSAGHSNSNVGFDQSAPSFEELLAELRVLVRRQPREPFVAGQQQGNFTEKNWLHYAARCWDMICKSKSIADYGRYLY